MKISGTELADFNYLNAEKKDSEELELVNIDYSKIQNPEYIKQLGITETELLLDRDDLDELDSEELFNDCLGKKKRVSIPPKEPYTTEEKDIVCGKNLRLIHSVINKFHNTPMDYDELYSVGTVGYVKALNSFDKSRGVKFSTYAINCIRNEVLFILRKEKKHSNNISLNRILSTDKNGNSLELEDTLSKTELDMKSTEEIIIEGENRELLLKTLKYLKEDEQYILIYRFGLNNGIVKTQKEIADEIGMSQANVSKIQKNCLNKLELILKKEQIDF